MISKDSFPIGLIAALIAPFVGGIIFYFIFFSYMEFEYFVKHIFNSGQWVSVLSLGVILNLGLFIYYWRRNRDRCARGVLAATFIYAFMVVFFKAF